ncbi:LLM class flavin-dependent oxidoreductase [Streptomyces sp. BE20]|uniref:MupA/Atu3671 family FMN-dependent luciferase-like monooxygenase n=1 Tax=Streptomyces sp. BE20 TaxID=3002525 RepID=UPI002E79FCDB|nr:MupA/Atu3671 family FMN-dependent luciferase-like monooxygenase [Streptomyces sp. BE20]MEE1825262.1 LLM class flavin-dependent oxidoreductase [Streptomyces sp. BE20]
MHFSLFYFADGQGRGREQYRLLLEGARFADAHGFSAVWTPERHFHEFGGQYPNPAVIGAALASVTERIGIRAGSVVGPLHHPVRIAEEWSVVDNLSEGRVGLSFASGWHANDFVLRPENYAGRKEVLIETIDTVRRLWRQEEVTLPNGDGNPVAVRSYPAPVQSELPVWLTSAGSPDTFRQAGEQGLGLLTHLLGQDLEDLAKKIAAYRAALPGGAGGAAGQVALMLHTFLGTDRDAVRETVRRPFTDYIRSSIGLIMKAAGDILPGVNPDELDEDDLEFLVERSFDRYFDTGGLFGTVEDGLATLERLDALGIDEVACLIDFGVDPDQVLAGLEHLDRLKDAWAARGAGS